MPAKGGKITKLKARKSSKPTRIPKPKKRDTTPLEKSGVAISYSKAPEVEAIANRLIGTAKGTSHLAQARIAYIWTTAETVGAEKSGTAQRWPARFTAFQKQDFLLMFSKPSFDRATKDEQEAIVLHQLLHCGSDEKGRWIIEPHDFNGFLLELDESGAWNEGLKLMRNKVQQLRLKFDKDDVGSANIGTGNGNGEQRAAT